MINSKKAKKERREKAKAIDEELEKFNLVMS